MIDFLVYVLVNKHVNFVGHTILNLLHIGRTTPINGTIIKVLAGVGMVISLFIYGWFGIPAISYIASNIVIPFVHMCSNFWSAHGLLGR